MYTLAAIVVCVCRGISANLPLGPRDRVQTHLLDRNYGSPGMTCGAEIITCEVRLRGETVLPAMRLLRDLSPSFIQDIFVRMEFCVSTLIANCTSACPDPYTLINVAVKYKDVDIHYMPKTCHFYGHFDIESVPIHLELHLETYTT